MDVETAEAIQRLLRMIDNVNQRNSLGQLTLNGVMVLLASNRRQGMLSEVEIKIIDQTFEDMETDEALERYQQVRVLFEQGPRLMEGCGTKVALEFGKKTTG
jgi:hypothetical protein